MNSDNSINTSDQYLIDNKEIRKEEENFYFQMRESEDMCSGILKQFGFDPVKSHIINGHVPVKVAKGENPIKANGKLLVIDGGFAKAYQKY